VSEGGSTLLHTIYTPAGRNFARYAIAQMAGACSVGSQSRNVTHGTGDRCLGRLVVAGDDQCATILRARWLPVGGERSGVDMVESLDDLRVRQVRLQELGGRGRLIVELRDMAVTFWVVVVGVDYDLALQRLERSGPVILQRHRDYDECLQLSPR